MIFRYFRGAASLLLLATCAAGCFDRGRDKVRAGDDVTDDFDQQQWANTSPVGDGSGESGAYYGSPGRTTEPSPARHAASPEPVKAARTPASPRPAND